MNIFFGDGDGPFIPEYDPDWFLEDDYEQEEPELKERNIRENILGRDKVPLKDRNLKEEKGKPFERWYLNVLKGQRKVTDPLDFTEEEQEEMLKAELEDDIERF